MLFQTKLVVIYATLQKYPVITATKLVLTSFSLLNAYAQAEGLPSFSPNEVLTTSIEFLNPHY